MTEPEFENLSLHELVTMQAELTQHVKRRRDAKRKEVLREIQELVKQHELSYDDVSKAIRTVSRRGKAPALYRNPDNTRQTWSGKGEAPGWFKYARDPEKLRIPSI